MAITYVGGQVGGRAGSTSTTNITFALSGGSNTTPQAGDLVVIGCAVGSQGRTPACAISGYTAGTQQDANGTTYDTSLNKSWKFMGLTPDTTFTLPSTGNIADAQRYTVQVWRGVDPANPFDVADVVATGTATGRPNPGSITPTTSGAVVGIIGAGAAATGAAYTAPANYTTNFLTGSTADTNDAMIGSGYRSWTSGAEDPAAYTGGTANAVDSWAAFTYALRPAVNNYTLTCQGGSYSLAGGSANISYVNPAKPNLISAVALNLGTSATPGAQTITVPASAQLVIVHASTYASGGLTLSLSSDFAGTFTTTTAGDGSDKCHIAYAVVSSTGTKTITPVWSAAVTDGPIFVVTFVNNVNTSDFLREAKAYNVNTQGSTTSTTITSSVSDLVLALERQALTTAIPTTMSGFTSITTSGINNIGTRLQSCDAPGSATTTLQSSGTDFPGFAAISIKAVSVGAYTLNASGGAYSLGGAAAILKRSKLITASGGSYSLAGANANLVKGRVLTAQAGTYSLTGASATLLRSKRIVASGGSYSLTGSAAVITKSKVLTAQGGVYNLTGASAVITYTAGGAAYVLTAQGGSYTLTGANATLSRNRNLTAQGGAYSADGSSTTILKSKRLVASGGTYSYTGGTAAFLKSRLLIAQGGSYSLLGSSAMLSRNRRLQVIGGTYTITGASAILQKAGGAVWPAENQVLFGVEYGPTGFEFTGSFVPLSSSPKLDITTGQMVLPLTDDIVMTL